MGEYCPGFKIVNRGIFKKMVAAEISDSKRKQEAREVRESSEFPCSLDSFEAKTPLIYSVVATDSLDTED